MTSNTLETLVPVVLILYDIICFVRFDLKHRLRLGTYHISCLGIFLDLFFLHRTDRTERELKMFFLPAPTFVLTFDLWRLQICGFHATMSWMCATGMQHRVQGSVQRASPIWIFEGK